MPDPIVLASTDPANPYGGTLSWPDTAGRPARNASSLVVLRAGKLLAWFDRRGHHLVTFPDTLVDTSWAPALMSLVPNGRATSIEVRKVNGDTLTGPDALAGVVEILRDAGFADGYRGMTYRG